jgi:signal peptidase I
MLTVKAHAANAVRLKPERTRPNQASRSKRILLYALRAGGSTILPGVLIALFVNVFVAQAMVVQGPSMKPNLTYNQRVVVDKITYNLIHGPCRGDVVIVGLPGEDELLVKRAVALPGETVAVYNGQVFINGKSLDEPWATHQGGLDYPPTCVPPRHVFVLGDNRQVSRDSRYFGPVPVDQISGQVRLVIWPLDRIGPIH